MSDSSASLCPTCGAPLEAGTCPRCLMVAAMVPTAHSDDEARQPAPSLEAVAAAFPQLEILELIGQGGMGCVFKARQPKLNRLVALKLLPASLAERDPAFAGRFEREGQLLARLHHPNIVAVHDSGTAGEFFYLVMEFVNGVNLRQAMRARRFTPLQALSIVPHICDALQYAHDEGVLHRDIKPENILLDAKGRVKLADFGIAKLLADSETPSAAHAPADAALTQSGATLGTPSYMAPEQRDTPYDIDHRADIYSLGVVFYELLTGELPRERFTPPSAKCEADPRVDAIVQQALEKERARRQHSADEVKTQVETLMQTPAPPAVVPASGELFLGLLSLAAVVSTAVGTWISWKSVGTASQTFIGLGEPWLVEGVYRYETGVLHATNLINSAWCVSSVAMMLATVFWVTWFWLKRAKGQPLDSFLGRGGHDHIIRVGGTWLAATAVSLWAFFFATGLYMAFFYKVLRNLNPEVPVTAIYILALALGFGWTLSRTIKLGSSPGSRVQTPGVNLAQANSIADPPTSLLPTIILHSVLFALVAIFFATVVPRFAVMYREMGVTLSPFARSLIEIISNRGILLLFPVMLIMDVGCCYLTRQLGGRRALRFCSSIVVVCLVLVIAISGAALFLPMQKVVTEFKSRGTPLPGREHSGSPGVESWSYTPRYLTGAKFAEWQKAGNDECPDLGRGISFKDEAGVFTLTGPRERVRRLATMLRVVDQPEVKNWYDLPILNMPPDFFVRTSLPALMLKPDAAKRPLTDALRDSLEREGVTASQLARALSAHVFELEKATFVNTGPPFESIKRSPGASTFYDATVPCADQLDKPLTLRIERTTQQMGTLSNFAGFAPWLIEEAKKKSKEPLAAAATGEAKDEAAKEAKKTNLETKAPSQPPTDVQLSIVQKNSVAEGSERNEWRLIGIRAAKPGWLHLWTPGGERFTHHLLGNTDYELRVAYRLSDSEPPLFQYWVDGLQGERRSHDIDLANRHLKFDDVAKSLREIRDPVGPCLRNMPYDLAHIGDSALLLAVTDTADPPSETPFFLHIWSPPLHTTPPTMAFGLATVVVRIGEMLTTMGAPENRSESPVKPEMPFVTRDGQPLGRISQRDGKFFASIRYDHRSTSMLDEFMTPEVPLRVSMYGFSGAIWPQMMVLSTKQDMTPFLKEEFFTAAPAETSLEK